MLRYDSGSAAPAEPPSCGWIDLVCVAVCRNNFEPLLNVYMCVCVSRVMGLNHIKLRLLGFEFFIELLVLPEALWT